MQVAPSRRETFGLSVAEGMAHGLPVVATTAGALAELIEDGETGWLCEPGDAPAIAERLLMVLLDPEHAAEIGARARAAVQQRFSEAAVLPQLLAAYEAALNRESPLPPRLS